MILVFNNELIKMTLANVTIDLHNFVIKTLKILAVFGFSAHSLAPVLAISSFIPAPKYKVLA